LAEVVEVEAEDAEDAFVGAVFESLIFVSAIEAELFGFDFGDAGFEQALEFGRAGRFGWKFDDVGDACEAVCDDGGGGFGVRGGVGVDGGVVDCVRFDVGVLSLCLHGFLSGWRRCTAPAFWFCAGVWRAAPHPGPLPPREREKMGFARGRSTACSRLGRARQDELDGWSRSICFERGFSGGEREELFNCGSQNADCRLNRNRPFGADGSGWVKLMVLFKRRFQNSNANSESCFGTTGFRQLLDRSVFQILLCRAHARLTKGHFSACQVTS
jgi:hypothetical protein